MQNIAYNKCMYIYLDDGLGQQVVLDYSLKGAVLGGHQTCVYAYIHVVYIISVLYYMEYVYRVCI